MSSSKYSSDQRVAFAIIEFLQAYAATHADDAEGLEVATQCISSAFNVDPADSQARSELSIAPHTLSEVFTKGYDAVGGKKDPKLALFVTSLKAKGYFDGAPEGSEEYARRYKAAVEKFNAAASGAKPAAASASASGASAASDVPNLSAEEWKNKGNALVGEKKYSEAITCYTHALEKDANNHIYYANRAAAYIYLEKYPEAVKDCEAAVRISPSYAKAYNRLGNAYLYQKKYAEAEKAYQKACDLEPENGSFATSLISCREKASAASSAEPAANANPFASLFGGAGGGAGGLDMNNLMRMASQMMQQPGMSDVVGRVAEGLMGGNGGNMGDLMSGLLGGLGNVNRGGDEPTSASVEDDEYEGEPSAADQSAASQQEAPSSTAAPTKTYDLGSIMGMLTPDLMARFQDPVQLQEFLRRPDVQSMKDKSPKFKQVIEGVETMGPMSVMGYMHDPEVLQAAGEFLDKMRSSPAGSSSSQ
jgi:small glutamine-rich tetratricopeptide repeat-containing protein alpha